MKKELVNTVKIPEHFTPSFWKYTYNEDLNSHRKIKDPLNNDYYLDEPKYIIRDKCFCLSLAVPIFHTAIMIANMTLCVLNSFYYLGKGMIFRDASQFAKIPFEIFKLLLAPFLLIFAELTAIIGILMPLNARKIFASIERFLVINYDFSGYLQKNSYEKIASDFYKIYNYTISDFDELINKLYTISYEDKRTIFTRKECPYEDDNKLDTFWNNRIIIYEKISLYKTQKRNFSILAACFQPKVEIDEHDSTLSTYSQV